MVVGNPESFHIGFHLVSAAPGLGARATIVDHRRAWGANRTLNRLAWRLAGKQPTRLRAFDSEVLAAVEACDPALVVVTGISAPSAQALRAIREAGVHVACYLTDDPWNPVNAARFFWRSLSEYDVVHTPRRSNIEDLRRHGCRRVEYLPFGYNPDLHFREPAASDEDRRRFACDVAIVGGADRERLPLARALAGSGLRLRLFGAYWDQHPETRTLHGGFVHGSRLRMAVAGATVNVCMVRRANRDGHSMRSLEIPAMGGCVVAEDTAEHRELLGDDDDCVLYYRSPGELVHQVRELCADPARAERLGRNLERRIRVEADHTYGDRLRRMMALAAPAP